VREVREDKNGKDDVYFSLQKFSQMAIEGQGIAIELLAAPDQAIKESSDLWEELRANRKRIYNKQMSGLIGFAKSQATKYSSRIERLNETEAILNILNLNKGKRLGVIWDELPISTNATKGENDRQSGDKRVYHVCGREIQIHVMVDHAIDVVLGIHNSYGERVKKAKDGQIDWKSYAHAFRAALQCREIIRTGDLKFPLADAQYLRDMRLGKYDFVEYSLDKKLDELIFSIENEMKMCNLPDSADKQYLENIILKAYNL
jgi:hypothetical protein